MKAVFLKYLVSHENFVPNTALGYRNGLKIPLNLLSTLIHQILSLIWYENIISWLIPPKSKLVPNWDLDAISTLHTSGDLASMPKEDAFKAALFLIAIATDNK